MYWLTHFMTHLPKGAIDRGNRAAIARVAAALPQVSGGGFEVHLGQPEIRLDCQIRVTETDRARAYLAADNDGIPGPISHFCRRWQQPGSVLQRGVENIWLEFDTPLAATDTPSATAPAPLPAPCIFFDVDRHESLDTAEKMACIQTALATLGHPIGGHPNGRADAHLAPLAQVLARAPDGVRIHYVGAMLSRPTRSLRICLQGLQPRAVRPYLDALGWRGDARQVDMALAGFARHADRLVLDLDIDLQSREIGPDIGIELSFTRSRHSQWRQLLSRFRRARLCSQRDAHFVLSRGPRCAVNHIKIACGGHRPPRAKAYLYSWN